MSKKDYSIEETLQALDVLEGYQLREIECFKKARRMRESLIIFLKSKKLIEALVYADKISEIYKSLIYEINENCSNIIMTYLDISTNMNDRNLYNSYMKDYEYLKDSYLKYRLIYDRIFSLLK